MAEISLNYQRKCTSVRCKKKNLRDKHSSNKLTNLRFPRCVFTLPDRNFAASQFLVVLRRKRHGFAVNKIRVTPESNRPEPFCWSNRQVRVEVNYGHFPLKTLVKFIDVEPFGFTPVKRNPPRPTLRGTIFMVAPVPSQSNCQ